MAEKAIIYYSNLNSNVAEINRVHSRIGLHFLKSGKIYFYFFFILGYIHWQFRLRRLILN